MVQRNALFGHHHANRHHLESKSRGGAADLKKKVMKKSASMKRSELESLRSTNLTTRIPDKQPGKPPPPADSVAPMKQSSPVSPMARTPNYMKSTSSSDARKEQKSRVSFKSPASDCCLRSSSKFKTLASESKATKTVNSLKTMRTLTKNSSFKVARASVRKCSPVVLCENLESQRATCSSTLKDCKFPAYLSLNPGGTESEGTSAIKVCPYTYCSLNGHHHPPLPPLKCFLSARRRMVKTQRGIKLGHLGNGDKLDDDFEKSPRISPEEEEGREDFFVDIFCVDDGGAKTSTLEEEEELDQEMVLDSPICDSVNACEGLDGDMDSCLIEIVSACLDFGDECTSGAVVEINHDGDELMADEESLTLYVVSDDGESAGSDDYPHGLNDVSQELEAEQEPAGENGKGNVEISMDDDKNSLQQEAVSETVASAGEVVPHPTENSNIESKPEADTLKPDEAGREMAGKVKSKDEVYSEAEDDAKVRLTSKTKKPIEESDDLGVFNPRPPNFLPLEDEPEAEKVDLRHQEVDEKRNTEEWMLDYALRQVVANLRPARKRKVALLVEAFEKVSPITKFEFHLSHSPVFGLPSPVQACR